MTCKNRPRNDILCVEWVVKHLHYYAPPPQVSNILQWCLYLVVFDAQYSELF